MNMKLIGFPHELLLTKKEALTLRRSRSFGTYADGREEGISKIRRTAKSLIPGMHEALVHNDHSEVKRLLSVYAGTEELFIAVFGKTPILRTRAPYFKGSFMVVLMTSFPQCDWSAGSFKRSLKRIEGAPARRSMPHLDNALKKAEARLFRYMAAVSGGKTEQYYERLLRDHPERFALQVVRHINSDVAFRKVLGGTLLHRKYYMDALAQDPLFSINWLKALVYLLPTCFMNEADVVQKARGIGLVIDIPARRSFRG